MRKINEMNETKLISLVVPKETHRRLKMLAAKLDTSINELCREGLEYIFKKYEEKNNLRKS